MTTNTGPLNSYAETVSYVFDSTDTYPLEVSLDYFIFSLGIYNNTANDVKVWTNKYGPADNYILIPAGAYKEIATLTDWFKVDAQVVGAETVSVDTVRSTMLDNFLTPAYPTIYSPAGDNNMGADIKINPINLGGYMWTPWVTSSGEASISAEEAVLNVEYWLNGDFVSNANTTNFYEDFYAMVMNTVTSFYPPGYNPTQPTDPAIVDEITGKIKAFLEGFDAPMNDEYIEGWAALTVYDDGLARTEVALNAAGPISQYQTPFEVLSWVVEPIGGPATIEHSMDGLLWANATVNSTTAFDTPAKYWRVTSGEIRLTFTGHAVKMISFAPIINIFYPIGFDDTSGLPADAFASWQNQLTNFKVTLQERRFTGRVIYWRSVPFEATPHPVFSADYYVLNFGVKAIDLVWDKVALRSWIWTSKSKMEDDLVQAVIDQNMGYLSGLPQDQWPKTLDDVLADPNLVVYGKTAPQEKLDILVEFLLNEYAGNKGIGTINYFFSRPR